MDAGQGERAVARQAPRGQGPDPDPDDEEKKRKLRQK